MEEAIAQHIIMHTQRPIGMCNSGAYIEYLVAKGVRYGIMYALSILDPTVKDKDKKYW